MTRPVPASGAGFLLGRNEAALGSSDSATAGSSDPRLWLTHAPPFSDRSCTPKRFQRGDSRFFLRASHRQHRYSITSSALVISDGDGSRPSALAVFKLMAMWNLVAASIGRLAAFSPLRMRST